MAVFVEHGRGRHDLNPSLDKICGKCKPRDSVTKSRSNVPPFHLPVLYSFSILLSRKAATLSCISS